MCAVSFAARTTRSTKSVVNGFPFFFENTKALFTFFRFKYFLISTVHFLLNTTIRSLFPFPPRTRAIPSKKSKSSTFNLTHSLTLHPVLYKNSSMSRSLRLDTALNSDRTSSRVSTEGNVFAFFGVLMSSAILWCNTPWKKYFNAASTKPNVELATWRSCFNSAM